MAAQPARALATDRRRWAPAPMRAPGAGALGTAPKPAILPTQRDSFAWGNKPVPPASNAWGSSSLLSLKNDEGSGLLANINVWPASRGSSGSSTSGSDLLDSPLFWGRNSDQVSASNVSTSHNSATATSRPQRTDSRSGSVELSHFWTSFSEALKAPLRSTAKRGPTSHGRGFTLSAYDFPVLVSKISESKSQLGHSSQMPPTLDSDSVATQDEERKNLIAGDPVPNRNLPMEAQKAQSHDSQAPNMPPPWLDHWNLPHDDPPDRNRMWHRGAASYGLHKPGNSPGIGILPAEPHLIPGKVKDSHSVTLEKQPIIKKDLVLLEKIRLLNIKARNLRAQKLSQIPSRRESKAEHPKSIDVKTDQVAKDIPFRAVASDIASACNLANHVSECPNLMLNGPSNTPPDCVIVDPSEGHVTESKEDRKLDRSTDYHVQKAKSMAKLEEVNSHSDTHSRQLYNAQVEGNKILRKQKAGGSGTVEHDTSTSNTCFIDYVENLNVPLTANGIKNATVPVSSTPPSDTAGVTRGPLIHNVTPSANKTDINMVERIPQKSAAQSNGTMVRKLLPMERQRQVHSQDRILRERSNIAERREHTRNVARTLMDTRRCEDKPRVGLSTENENTEASRVHKNRTSGVVINSSIIPMQVASVRGFTVGSIMLGDVSLASVNQETEQSGKDNYGVELAKDAQRNDGVKRTPVKEPSKIKQSDIDGLNCAAIPAPSQLSGDHSIVRENAELTKMRKMEKPAWEEQNLQDLGQITMLQGLTTCYGNSSASKLEGGCRGKEALDTSTATKNEVQAKAGSRKAHVQDKKNRKGNEAGKHSSSSSASGNQVSMDGLTPVKPKLAGGANFLLLNVMQELSEMSQQVESSTYANYTDRRSTMHNFHKGAPLPMAHLLPQPFARPQVGALVNGVPGWKWDLNEGILVSDMENFHGLGTATMDRSSGELAQNVSSSGAVDLYGGQVVGDMVFQAANPGIQYHTGLKHQHLSPAWHLPAQHDRMHHGGSGTGVYWPNMERDAEMQTHGVGEYHVEPVASSGAAYDWSAAEYQVEPVALSASGAVFGWSQGHQG